MDVIRENKLRIGNITNSKVGLLFGNPTKAEQAKGAIFGKGALTYIEERNFERQMDLPITVETSNHPFSWGKACEIRIFEILGTEYKMMSRETLQHPTIDYWTGSPDGEKIEYTGSEEDEKVTETVVGVEFKCPITRKSYMTFYNCEDINQAREKHTDGEDYFWQATAGSMLIVADKFVKAGLTPEEAVKKMMKEKFFCELIIYMPYKSELQEIREIAQNFDLENLHQFFWIFQANDEELPYIKDGGKVLNKKEFRWEVSEEDKLRLTQRVTEAGKLLIPRQ